MQTSTIKSVALLFISKIIPKLLYFLVVPQQLHGCFEILMTTFRTHISSGHTSIMSSIICENLVFYNFPQVILVYFRNLPILNLFIGCCGGNQLTSCWEILMALKAVLIMKAPSERFGHYHNWDSKFSGGTSCIEANVAPPLLTRVVHRDRVHVS